MLKVSSTSTLTIINLIYHFVTLVIWVHIYIYIIIFYFFFDMAFWVFITLVSIRPRKPNSRSRTLRFDLEHQRARKKNGCYDLNWNIDFYDRNLDFGDSGQDFDISNFGWKQLLWPELSQLWAWNIFGHFFFSTRENWVVVFASRRNNGSVACHLDKERDSCGCVKRNSLGTGRENWRKKKLYTINICGLFDIGYDWRCKRMSEPKKKKKNWHMILCKNIKLWYM